MVKVKIITVHFGQLKPTFSLLNNLNKLSNLNNLILVNNSSAKIGHQIKIKFPKIHLINNPKNLGYGAALNIGIKLALEHSPYFILILNNDLVVKENFLKELLNYSQKENVDLVSPKILDEEGKVWFNGGEIDKKRFTAGHTPYKLDFLSGCCLLIKSEVFKKIGFFDEQYFMYYEDVDFCFRAKKAGFKLGIAEKAIVYHQKKKTKKGIKLMNYYLARNHLLFVKKYAPLFVKLRELIRLPKTLWEHYRKKEFSALAGIKDALLKRTVLRIGGQSSKSSKK